MTDAERFQRALRGLGPISKRAKAICDASTRRGSGTQAGNMALALAAALDEWVEAQSAPAVVAEPPGNYGPEVSR